MTFLAKMVMAGLPNIEPVSLMVMLFAVTSGERRCSHLRLCSCWNSCCTASTSGRSIISIFWLILAAAAWLLRG